jgi:hypothetical protein
MPGERSENAAHSLKEGAPFMLCRAFRGWLLAVAFAGSCAAWHTPPHRQMTKAAVDTLPKQQRARLGAEEASLVGIYCILPDRYIELEQYGFTRSGPGPKTLPEMEPYCRRPDGEYIHSAVWDQDEDLASLVFLCERIVAQLVAGDSTRAASYMGTMAHFIEDSLSPPHSVDSEKMMTLAPAGRWKDASELHASLERSLPSFDLGPRQPRKLGDGIVDTANEILQQLYAGSDQNRQDLAAMVKAASASDEAALNPYRLRSGARAAEILADSLFTLCSVASKAPAAAPRK